MQNSENSFLTSFVETNSDLRLEITLDGTIIQAHGKPSLLNTTDSRLLVLCNLFRLLNSVDLASITANLKTLSPGQRISFEDPNFAPSGRLFIFTMPTDKSNSILVSISDLVGHIRLESTSADDHLIRAFRSAIFSPGMQAARQPIVDTSTGKLHHYEMLSRFPFEGSPYPFIVAAEKRGIICELDFIMLENACARLQNRGGKRLKLAINISGDSIQRPDIANQLVNIIKTHEFKTQNLTIEITESSRILDLDLASHTVDQLKSLGVKVVLDDFGAGAASFGYLRSLNVDGVKFDGSFLNGQESNQRNIALMRAIVQMCRELGMSVVGERVETAEDRQTLLETGVTLAQGYYFGRPKIDDKFFAARKKGQLAA